jgi:hypothetical protein
VENSATSGYGVNTTSVSFATVWKRVPPSHLTIWCRPRGMGQNETRLGIGLPRTNILYRCKYRYGMLRSWRVLQVPSFAQSTGIRSRGSKYRASQGRPATALDWHTLDNRSARLPVPLANGASGNRNGPSTCVDSAGRGRAGESYLRLKENESGKRGRSLRPRPSRSPASEAQGEANQCEAQ